MRLGAVVTPLLLGLAGLSGCGSSASASPPPCSGSTPAALTVKNYLDWCAVSIEGAAPSSAATQTVCVADGTVALSASALTGFELGPDPWHRTAGDTGAGDPGTVTGTGQTATSSTTVNVTGSSACVWVCCPFPDGTGCPTADPCAAPPPPPGY